MTKVILLSFVALLLYARAAARANEVCHFAGTTDYSGRVVVTSKSETDEDGTNTIDVALQFDGKTMPFVHVRYLLEEISRWKSGELQSLAVNSRYLIDGHIVRQQWDEFERGHNALEAYRVQGKTEAEFRLQHPGFAQHWDPASFGKAWLGDYRRAAAERRADLDLALSNPRPHVYAPLALAFYWTARLPPKGEAVEVVLPGFKRDKQVDFTITAAGPASNPGERWQAAIHHPALNTSRASAAEAWVSKGHLLQLTFTAHSSSRTARGSIRAEGCDTNSG